MNGMKTNPRIKKAVRCLLILCSLLVLNHPLLAQQRQVSGRVTESSDGQAIPGVVVKVKGKNTGTSTNANGNFTISAQTGDVLQISSIGFTTKEVTVTPSGSVNVSLAENNQELDEVVVVGYGVQQKKLVTGATVQVKGFKVVKAFPGKVESKGIWFGTDYNAEKDEWFAFHYVL